MGLKTSIFYQLFSIFSTFRPCQQQETPENRKMENGKWKMEDDFSGEKSLRAHPSGRRTCLPIVRCARK
jgi:hypothetical protein